MRLPAPADRGLPCRILSGGDLPFPLGHGRTTVTPLGATRTSGCTALLEDFPGGGAQTHALDL